MNTTLHQPKTIFTPATFQIAIEQEKRKEIEQIRKKSGKYSMETYVALLDLLIGSEFVMECNDALAGTNAYRHELKRALKQLLPILEKMIDDDLGQIIAGDDLAVTTFNLQDGFRKFIEQLRLNLFIKHSPSLIAGFGELMEQFHNAPELTLHRLGIKIKES